MNNLRTVGDYIRRLQEFPEEWLVQVATPAGGEIAVEHREIKGNPIVAIFGSNGGRFGENPLTEEEYKDKSGQFMRMWNDPAYSYTSIHGDHRLYRRSGLNDTCYGTHFDRRIVERIVADGLISGGKVDIDRVRKCEGI